MTAANNDKPLLGLFADGNMPVRWKGPKASHHGNIDQAAVTCEVNKDGPGATPTLAQMITKAIDLLKTNPNGFFLQVEGASIDKEDHAAKLWILTKRCSRCSPSRLNRAIRWCNGADHAHSSQIIANGSKAAEYLKTAR